MNKRIELFNNWIKERNRREQWYLFGLGFGFLYAAWYFIFMFPLTIKEKKIILETENLSQQQTAIQKQTDSMEAAVHSKVFLDALSQRKKLISQADIMQRKLKNSISTLNVKDLLASVTKDIFSQQNNQVYVISLKNLSSDTLSTGNEQKDQTPVNLFKHKLEITLHGNYFNTLAYLTRLEKLPWHLYWDSFDYKVNKYPDADVIINFHLLSNEKGSQ